MTLRYSGNRPVGLDWSAITTENNPEVWAKASPVPQRKTRTSDTEEGNQDGAPGRTRLSPLVERQIIKLYRDEQLSAKQVAERVGVQSATVFKVLARNGVPSRTRSEGSKLRADRGQA